MKKRNKKILICAGVKEGSSYYGWKNRIRYHKREVRGDEGMKKRNKKILICAGVVAVVAGGAAVAGNGGAKEASAPAVPVETAVVGDVEQIVDATGTVVSEEQKTFFSPVNAKISEVSFEEGDSVKEGTKLITFDMENLEKDNQKAAMSLFQKFLLKKEIL